MTMRPNGGARWTVLPVLSIGLLVAACGASNASVSPSPLEPSPAATAAETVVVPTAAPVHSTEPSLPSEPSDPPLAQPPAASLAVDGGDPVVGELGSFTWQDGGSDSPWLPGTPIRVGNGERFTLTLADPIGIGSWTASYVSAADLQSATSVGLGEGTGAPVTFDVPPPGAWSVYVSVRFAENLGSAAYFWHVEVD
jgi:hypothetical protein